jgi:hypothetical protein
MPVRLGRNDEGAAQVCFLIVGKYLLRSTASLLHYLITSLLRDASGISSVKSKIIFAPSKLSRPVPSLSEPVP